MGLCYQEVVAIRVERMVMNRLYHGDNSRFCALARRVHGRKLKAERLGESSLQTRKRSQG